MPKVGEQAPDFELPNQDGKLIKLSDLRGTKVIIFIYPKAATSGCTIQACGFRDHFPKIETSNATVFGLSADTQQELIDWKKAENLPYDLLSDVDHQVIDTLGAWGERPTDPPTTGIIRSYWVIDEEGKIIAGQVGISPTDSVEQALAAVSA